MTKQVVYRTVVVTAAFVAATLIGWWALPIAAAIFGAITRDDRSGPIVAGASAILSWAVILAFDAWIGPVGRVAATLGGVLQVRPVAVYALALAFPGLLAVSASLLARGAARALTGRPAT